MDRDGLFALLAKGESLHVEFKQWPVAADDLAAELVAMGNTDGGRLVLGINDRGEIVGVAREELDAVMRFVDNVAFNNCAPPLTVLQETVQDEKGRTVLVVNVPKGSLRPYRTNRGIYYLRTASGRRQASREELLRLFQDAESLYFDETMVANGKREDLDPRLIEELLRRVQEQGHDLAGIATERLLKNWRLLVPINADIRPSMAGLLFLCRTPQQFIPYAYVSALRIPGDEIALEPLDQKRIEGPLTEMLEDAMRFLELHLLRPHRIRRLEPEIRPELPAAALREALVNALAHRDYTITAPIRLLVFDGRVEIRTPGRLPNTVTVDSLRQGVHVLRNPHIYNIFLKLGLVTDAGSGIPRMIRLVREVAGREPEFQVVENEFVTILPRISRPQP